MNDFPKLPIGSKIIPDKMTSWEIEKLTKNVLLLDVDLKAETNVYAILHQIAKETDNNMDLFYDYLLNHIEPVINAFFDDPLEDDEYIAVVKEIIMCINKYEGIPALEGLIHDLTDTFDQFILGYEAVNEGSEDSIAEQLAQAERELNS